MLAGFEERFLGGASIAEYFYFDLIASTSTGGILAIGLSAALTAAELIKLYVERGCDFPSAPAIGRLWRHWRANRRDVRYIYDQTRSPASCRKCCGTGRSDPPSTSAQRI